MKNVAILTYEGCWAMSVHLINDFFRIVELLEKHQNSPRSYNTTLMSVDGQPVTSASNAIIVPDGPLAHGPFDLIIVPPIEGWRLNQMPADTAPLLDWLTPYWHSSTVVLTLSTGAFFLAASGALAPGSRCATHWAFTKPLRQRFPDYIFSADQPWIKSRNIYSTSTFEASIDVLLALVARDKGDRFSQQCAASLLVDEPRRLPPILPDCREHDDNAIFSVQDWIEHHSSRPITIAELASLFGFSERNLKRRFTLATGLSVNKYIQAVRLDRAKKLLLSSDKTVKDIALDVGYENDGFFTRLFKTATGQTPAQWRTGGVAGLNDVSNEMGNR